MKSRHFLWGLLFTVVVSGSGYAATVEWDVQQTLKMDQPPQDVAISPDGRHVFVLSGSIIRVFDKDGKPKGDIDVGHPADQLEIDPGGTQLFVTSRQNKTVEVMAVDFIEDIHVTGAPYKGGDDAPVVIAVFSDFQ